MGRKIANCEYCGDDLGGEVEKYPGEIVTCGKRGCERYARDCYQEEREQSHEQLDRDMGYY